MAWISVKERVPSSVKKYQIKSETQEQSGTAMWNGIDWINVNITKGSLMMHHNINITHWMPLPEPPK